MKQLTIALLAVLALHMAPASSVETYAPADWNLQARKAFAEQRFGIFIHWGLYANYAQGEWYLETGKVNEADYSRMIDGFCPSKFDAAEWVRVFKRSGAKYLTVTSRHHDGFSLWPSKADDGYNIANTPFKRDILGELALACQKENIQLNFYYSLMDWHRPDYPMGRCRSARSTLVSTNENYSSYKKFMMAQITELIDRYSPGVIWFDGEWDHEIKWSPLANPIDWELDDIYDLIHSKKTLVANNHHLPIRPKEDIQIFERDLPGENDSGFSVDGVVTRDRPLEQCDVIQHNVWGYRIGEKNFRTAEDIVAMVARAAAKDSNLLMNIGPDGSGRLPAKAVEVMEQVGKWFEKNGESIYGTSAGGVELLKSVVSTRKGRVLYLHFLDPKVSLFAFRADRNVASATALADGSPVKCERTPSGDIVVTVNRENGNKFDYVVKVEFN